MCAPTKRSSTASYMRAFSAANLALLLGGVLVGSSNAQPVGSQDIPMSTGWNLVSVQVGTNHPLAAIQSLLSNALVAVWAYDASSRQWRSYQPSQAGYPNDLQSIEPGRGYWLKLSQSRTLTLAGQVWSGTVQLQPGWNLVGLPGLALGDSETLDFASIFRESLPRIPQAWTWEGGTSQRFVGFDTIARPAITDLASVRPGRGYWLHSLDALALTPNPVIALAQDSDISPLQTEEPFDPGDPRFLCPDPAPYSNQLVRFAGAEDSGEDLNHNGILDSPYSKLRRINVTSVRGPNHAGPITAEPISVREQVLGLRVEGTNTLNLSLRQFRDWLEQKRQTNFFNPLNPLLQFEFSTGIADNSYFPATGSRWNMRIASITIDLLADTGFSTKQVAEIDLIESGMTTLRRFWAEPPLADDLFNLTFNVGRADRSAFGIVVPAKINGANGGRPASEFIATGLADRPIAATRWLLTLDTGNPSNRDLNFSKLKDIVIRFTYTYGNPPEFPNF